MLSAILYTRPAYVNQHTCLAGTDSLASNVHATHARARAWRLRLSIKRSRVIANNRLLYKVRSTAVMKTRGGDSDRSRFPIIRGEGEKKRTVVSVRWSTTVPPRHRSLLDRSRSRRVWFRSMFRDDGGRKMPTKISACIHLYVKLHNVQLRPLLRDILVNDSWLKRRMARNNFRKWKRWIVLQKKKKRIQN